MRTYFLKELKTDPFPEFQQVRLEVLFTFCVALKEAVNLYNAIKR